MIHNIGLRLHIHCNDIGNTVNKLTSRFLLLICLVGVLSLAISFYTFRFIYPREKAFGGYLLSTNVNKAIVLYRNPLTEYPFRQGQFIALGVKNQSQEIVAFPATSMGIQLFVFRDEGWIKVENTVQNLFPFKTSDNSYSSRKPLPTDMYFLAPKGMEYEGVVSDGFLVVNAIPVLVPSDLPVTLRFMVVGTIYRDGQPTQDQVVAYIDIKVVQ